MQIYLCYAIFIQMVERNLTFALLLEKNCTKVQIYIVQAQDTDITNMCQVQTSRSIKMEFFTMESVIQFPSTSHLKFEKVLRPALCIVSIISLLTKCTIFYLK